MITGEEQLSQRGSEDATSSSDYRAICGFFSFDSDGSTALSQFETYVSLVEKKLNLNFQKETGKQFIIAGLGPSSKLSPGFGSSTARIVIHRSGGNHSESKRTLHTVCASECAAVSLLENNTVTLCRGQSGAHNLYYISTDSGVLFSSHISFYLCLDLPQNFDSIALFLRFLYIPAPHTIYAIVKAVLPGQLVSISAKETSMDKLVPHSPKQPVSFGDAGATPLDKFHNILATQVSRAIGDRRHPVILLSGGKDSSSLAIAAASLSGKEVETVTVGFRDTRLDETGDAAMVARSLGLKHHKFYCSSEDMLTHLEEFVLSCGQPMGDAAALPLFLLFKKLAVGYDLLIDGTGNDSYFGLICGAKGRALWQVKRQLFGGFNAEGLALRLVGDSVKLAGLRRVFEPVEEQFVSMGGFSAVWIKSKTALVPDWRGTELYRVFEHSATANEHFTKTVCGIWEPEAAYRKTVQNAGLNGLDIAFPFLGQPVREFVEDLDEVWRIRGGVNKRLIRDYLSAHLPAEIVKKPKGSFVVPKGVLLDPERNPYMRKIRTEGLVIEGRQIVSAPEIRKLFQLYRNDAPDMKGKLYALLILSVWSVVSASDRDKVQLWF